MGERHVAALRELAVETIASAKDSATAKDAASGKDSVPEIVGYYDPFRSVPYPTLGRFGTFEALCDRSDAVVIASPSETHSYLSTIALSMGKVVLVEKPLALSLVEIATLEKCPNHRTHLWVGQSERFHPLAARARGWVDAKTALSVEARRFVPQKKGRTTSPSSLFELAIHDADLLSFILGAPLSQVSIREAQGVCIVTCNIGKTEVRIMAGATDGFGERTLLVRTSQETMLFDWLDKMAIARGAGGNFRSTVSPTSTSPLVDQMREFLAWADRRERPRRLASFQEARDVVCAFLPPSEKKTKAEKLLHA